MVLNIALKEVIMENIIEYQWKEKALVVVTVVIKSHIDIITTTIAADDTSMEATRENGMGIEVHVICTPMKTKKENIVADIVIEVREPIVIRSKLEE